jgi:hypothetical protein
MIFDTEEEMTRHAVYVHGVRKEVKHVHCGENFYTDEGYWEHLERIHGQEREAG